MLENFINIDKAIFRFFNSTTANPLFDLVMPIITDQNIWAIPILILICFLTIKGGRKGQITSVILIIAVSLADYSSAQILKPKYLQHFLPYLYTKNTPKITKGCLFQTSSHPTS